MFRFRPFQSPIRLLPIYTASPAQINMNTRKSSVVNGSLYNSTPIIRLIVGEMYWKKPTVENGISFTAVPYSNSGTAVTTPLSMVRNSIPKPLPATP